MGRGEPCGQSLRTYPDEVRYRHKSVRVSRRRQAEVEQNWRERGWELDSVERRRSRTELTFRRERVKRVWPGLLLRLLVVLCVTAGLVVGSSRLPSFVDPVIEVRADADEAIRALESGDLDALEAQLAANRGQAEFAYFFAQKTTPRSLGDALATVAGEGADAPLKEEVDAHAYDLLLTDLAGTLGLATFGMGDRSLAPEWVDDFITATTTPESLYGEASEADDAEARAAQDRANKQNLLLLLSRGYWSTEFLETVTDAYWLHDQEQGDDAWANDPTDGAKYAPAPTGHYLTDGMLALLAALTANPEASAWAFTQFRPGTQKIDGSDHAVGKFTHYVLFEHQFPESSDGESLGMTSVLTAMSSAIEETGETADEHEEIGPMADSLLLQSLAKEVQEGSGCSWNPLDYWDCAVAVAKTVWHWIEKWGHLILDILTQSTFIPPPFNAVGVAAAATNATWYAIEGDYVMAGLSLAAAVPGLTFVKIVKGVKAGTAAEAAAAQTDDVASATRKIRLGVERTVLERAQKDAAQLRKGSARFAKESEPQSMRAAQLRGAETEKSFVCPVKAIVCGVWRRIDIYHADSKTAIEVKIGTTNQAYAIKEVQKDLELLSDPSSGITKVVWEFFPNAAGKVGPSDKLRVALTEAGIRYVLHLP